MLKWSDKPARKILGSGIDKARWKLPPSLGQRTEKGRKREKWTDLDRLVFFFLFLSYLPNQRYSCLPRQSIVMAVLLFLVLPIAWLDNKR